MKEKDAKKKDKEKGRTRNALKTRRDRRRALQIERRKMDGEKVDTMVNGILSEKRREEEKSIYLNKK